MTKFLKFLIAIVIIIQIVLFVYVGLTQQNLTNKNQDELMKLYAKRDELLISQQRLEVQFLDLNNTLQREYVKMEDLSNTLDAVAKQYNATPVKTVVTKVVSIPAPVSAPVTPISVPTTPPPVTRAS
jgi:hypothetical protein